MSDKKEHKDGCPFKYSSAVPSTCLCNTAKPGQTITFTDLPKAKPNVRQHMDPPLPLADRPASEMTVRERMALDLTAAHRIAGPNETTTDIVNWAIYDTDALIAALEAP